MGPKIATVVLLYLCTIAFAVSPAVYQIRSSLSIYNGTLGDVWPFCFSPESHPGIDFTNSGDCTAALRLVVLEPGFLVPITFSKNSRRGIKLPKRWKSGRCVIFISCANDRDADTFTYAHVAQQARKVIQTCVDGRVTPYGGMDEIGSVQSFYVSVGRPVILDSLGDEMEGVNGTDLIKFR